MAKTITYLSKKLSDIETATLLRKDYYNKKVYSTSGDYVGRVKDVVLKNNQLAGIIVKGKRKLYIDHDYCTPGTVDSILLNIDPVTMLKGKTVFDAHGKKIGKVHSIKREGIKNDCTALLVKKNIITKPQEIPYNEVDISKKNIILKTVR